MSKNINEELLQARDRLVKISEKVKQYIQGHNESSDSAVTTVVKHVPNPSSDLSLEEIHDKLRKINVYLKKQVTNFTAVQEPSIENKAAEPVVIPEPSVETKVTPPPAAGPDRPAVIPQPEKQPREQFGLGLDLGTSYINAAREVGGKDVFIKSERNAFLSVRCDNVTRELLTKLNMKYCVAGDGMYVLGNNALDLATIFNRESQHTMSYGILNPLEAGAIPMIKLLVQNVLWEPRMKGEICCFSVPAPPVDKDQDTVYHRSVFEGMLRVIGFEPIIIDEGYAVVLSELAYKDFTGIGISCGGGLINICAAFKSVPIFSFSISRGGDWIDRSAAAALGISSATVTSVKERGISITNPTGREEEAIAIYYRNYIHYLLMTMMDVLSNSANAPKFKEPVDIVFAGGSSMVGGFLDVVKEELKTMVVGIPLGSVTRAEEPFTSVVRGCLFSAINTAGKRS